MLFFKQAKKPDIRKEVLADEKKGVESSRSFLFVHCILSQIILEEMILYFTAFVGAGIAIKFLLPRISNSLAIMQGNSIALELSFGWQLVHRPINN